MRGSLSSPMPSERTSFNASFTRRILSPKGDHVPLGPHELELLSVQKPLGLVEESAGLSVLTCDARDGEPRALPEIVVIHFRHRGAEAVLKLCLRGLDVLPLPL